uniref:Uncharacterized protein n=1 Tax=Candidatus Kentrum sp. DK TaxID=2126562 RepID=A0A450TEK7_9GAMM|nr:MAG: hypothetical protein BECKDK2373B_GA0170837_11518 [Candidatus Kentron sp. DK]
MEGFLAGARTILSKSRRLKEIDELAGEQIHSATASVLNRILQCHLSNRHSIMAIVGDCKLRLRGNEIWFFDESSIELSYLIETYAYEPALLAEFPKLRENMGKEDGHEFQDEWNRQITNRWPHLADRCLKVWKSLCEEHSLHFRFQEAKEFLLAFSPAVNEPSWLEWTLNEFLQKLCSSGGSFTNDEKVHWKLLIQDFKCWSGATAVRLIEGFDEADEPLSFEIIRPVLSPSSQLSASDRICLALLFLMRMQDEFIGMRDRPSEDKTKAFDVRKDEIGAHANGDAILWLFSRLQDLPSHHYNHHAPWKEFGPDEKAIWRAEIVKYVIDQHDARHGLIEYLLWQITGNRFRNDTYSEMEILILALCKREEDLEFLARLQEHPSRLVQVRSVALLARLGQRSEPDPFTPLLDDGVTVSASHQALAVVAGGGTLRFRTWMQDGTVERVIYDGVRRVEKSFCEEYEQEWRLDEEMHLSSLLAKVQGALGNANKVLIALAPHGIGVAPKIDFSFRQIPKREEGASGVGSDSFATDVAFIIRVTDAGRLVTHRAAFVQCKKLSAREDGTWKPSFDIKRDQCDDLIAQTESAFFLFLGPAFVGREVWITPARLVRNLSDLHGTKGTLPHAPTYYASRSFAHWLTYDLFGLWTGDERQEIVEKAKGGKPGYSPRFVVSVVIHRNPTKDEGQY